MTVLKWYDITFQGFENLLAGAMDFLPKLIGALVVFVIGWFISMIVGRVVADILKRIQFNQLFAREGLKKALERAELRVDPSEFIGGIFMWTLMVVFLLASVDILGLDQLGVFLQSVLAFLPNVLIASLIFVVAVIISDIVEKVLRATVESAQMGSGHIIGLIVKWSIWIFTASAILVQLFPAIKELIFPIIQGLIYFFVIAGGLAFGFGGKDIAAEFLQEVKRKLKG